VIADLTLIGFGEVQVVVKSPSGLPVEGAEVLLAGVKQWSDANGAALFNKIRSGQYYVQSKLPAHPDWTTSGQFIVQAGQVSLVVMTLQKRGTIAGRVFAPDGVTPAAEVVVSLGWYGERRMLTDRQGRFSFSSLSIESYYLEARIKGQLRASPVWVTLSTEGEVKEHHFVLLPVGTVTGTVSNSNGAPVANVWILINHKNPLGGWQGTSQTTVYSQSDGSYQAENIPLGPVTIDARKDNYSSSGHSLSGANAQGSLRFDQEVLVINLSLTDNIVQLPAPLQMPGSYYTFSQTGSVKQEGHISRECECNRLSLTVDGQTAAFPTGLFGRVEENRQEISTIMQEGPGGIVMTRKLYVPKNGYAVRGLELLNNPTDEPMTVTLQLASSPSSWSENIAMAVTEIQSGEGWFLISGKEKTGRISPISWHDGVSWNDTKGDEAVGFVFGRSAKRGQLFLQNTPVITKTEHHGWGLQEQRTVTITYGMKDVIIKPGETVGLLHFYFMPWNKEGEQPTLNRLRSLPPEMLEGLSHEELSSIINFDLEKDRDLELTAPQIISKLSVSVFQKALEQLIPLPNMRVEFKSADPIYPLTYAAMTNPEGLLMVEHQSISNEYNVPILPRGKVDLQAFENAGLYYRARDAASKVSPSVTAVDEAGVLSSTLVFTKTGVATLPFERPGGITGNAWITLTHKESKQTYSVPSIAHPSSSATFLTLLPGRYEAAVFIDHPQSPRKVFGFVELDVAASLETVIAIPIEQTGHLEGRITTAAGLPAGNQQVSLSICNSGNCNGSYYSTYSTITDVTGHYQFIHLPTGPVKVAVSDPHTGSITQATLDIVGGATGSKDLILAAFGKIRLKVVLPNGLPAINSSVSLIGTQHARIADDQGMVLFKDVLVGSYTVRAFRPEAAFNRFFSEQSVILQEHGETVETSVLLPAAGTVSVKVETASGVPVPGQYIQLTRSPQNNLITVATSWGDNPHPEKESLFADKDGITNPVKWAGPILMSLNTQSAFGWTPIKKEESALLEGENRIVVVRLPVMTRLSVTVTVCGTPAASRNLVLFNAENKEIFDWTNKEGKSFFKNVLEGEYRLRIPGIAALVLVSVRASNDGHADIAFPLCTVNVKGRVVAGDGETGIPHTTVSIKKIDGEAIGVAWTSYEGEFDKTIEGMSGEKIIVETSIRDYDIQLDYKRSQTVTIDADKIILSPFVIPISVVKGKIGVIHKGRYEPYNPTWVGYGSLFATNPTILNAFGYARVHQEPRYFGNGRYLFLGLPLGDFEVTVHNSDNGKTVTQKGRVESTEKAVEVDLLFPSTNDLLVRVKDADGKPVKSGVIGADEIGSSFTILRKFSEEDSGSFWKSESGKLFREGDKEEEWTWNEKRETSIREAAGGLWIRDKETQQEIFHSGVGGEWIFKGEVGEVLLDQLPANSPLVVAFANKEPEQVDLYGLGIRMITIKPDIISKPVFLSLPESSEQITVTLLLPGEAFISGQVVAADGVTKVTEGSIDWSEIFPTPFGSGSGLIESDDQGRFSANLPEGPVRLIVRDGAGRMGIYNIELQRGERRWVTLSANRLERNDSEEENQVDFRLMNPEYGIPINSGGLRSDISGAGTHILNDDVLRLRIGEKGLRSEWGSSWGALSAGVVPVTRRFVPLPSRDRGLLSIEQVSNPYPVPITLTVSLEEFSSSRVRNHYHQSGGTIRRELSLQNGMYLLVFGSSLENQGQRFVVPALSCRTIVHLWDILPIDEDILVRGENFAKGVDLLNRFATLDLRKLVEDPSCPLAE
jgi:hypothetical protein